MERCVINMNCMAVAFGGTAKQRKEMAQTLLGQDDSSAFNPEDFESIMAMGFLASTPAPDNGADNSIKEWAKAELAANPIQVK